VGKNVECELANRSIFFCKLKLEAGVSFLCRPYVFVIAVVLVVTFFLITVTYVSVFWAG